MYEELKVSPRVYLLGDVIDHKPYSSDELHDWVRQDSSLAGVYGKIRDLLQSRILAAISDNRLEKTTGEAMLKTFYYKPFESQIENQQQKVYTRMDNIVYNGEQLKFIVGDASE